MTVQTETATIKTLLAGIIDYAGLFPPAKLDMAATVSNYAGYLAGSEAWMLGRLVVPVARLDEFEAAAKGVLGGDEPWHLSALTVPAGDPGLQRDLERVAAFNETHANARSGLARIGSIELRGAGPGAIEAALDLVPDEIFPFFELAADADPRGPAAALAGSDAGAKIRTGGTEPSAYPAPAQVARFIAGCAAADVPFKATAGLHQPLAHRNESVGADELGFLNVFVAAALAKSRTLDEAAVREVLADRSAGSFSFTDSTLAYRDHELALDVVEATRQHFAISFGSCSFTEPIDGLRALKLL